MVFGGWGETIGGGMRALSVLLCGLLSAATGLAYAADVKVEFKEPKKFTDIKAGNEPKGAFERRILAGFEQIFADLAAKLPEGYSWNIVVTDIDLAGDVNYMFTQSGQDIRVVKDIFFPRVNFSYELLDANKKVVLSDELKLKDMGFMSRSNISRNQVLDYEKDMLERWFKDKLQPALATATSAAKVN